MKKIALFLLTVVPCIGKILIIVPVYNRPDFIEWQVKTFRKFLQDEYEYVVFNDARNAQTALPIIDMCNKYGVKCFPMPQSLHHDQNAGARNGTVVQYALDVLGFKHDDIIAFFDSDMFLVRPFSIRECLREHDIYGRKHFRIFPHLGLPNDRYEYLGLEVFFLNIPKLPNIASLKVATNKYGDCGASTHDYLTAHPEVRVKNVEKVTIPEGLFDANELQKLASIVVPKSLFYEGIQQLEKTRFEVSDMGGLFDDLFLHYFRGTNWNGMTQQYHFIKTKFLQGFIDRITQ